MEAEEVIIIIVQALGDRRAEVEDDRVDPRARNDVDRDDPPTRNGKDHPQDVLPKFDVDRGDLRENAKS